MKERKQSIIYSILSLIFAFILYYLSLFDSTISDKTKYPFPFNSILSQEIYNNCCDSKAKIALGVFVVLIILHLIFYFTGGRSNKKWLQQFMKHIIDQNLGGAEYETRITIFHRKKGWKFIIPYMLHHIRHGHFYEAFKCRPHLSGEYLVIYNRFSFPKQNKSYTFFRAIQEDNIEPESVVEKCYKTGKTVTVTAPYISDITLPENISSLPSQDKEKVKKYMSKTGTKNYHKLFLLNRRANYIYALPIRQNEEIWGVVVFDNNQVTSVNIEEKLRSIINDYQKIIQFTIQIYK